MSDPPNNPIEATFSPLYGLPCWNVKPGHGSFLTLDFGEPRLEFREPREAEHSRSLKIKNLYARRLVTLHGDWHLWVYCCYWNFFLNGRFVGDSNSEKGIQKTVVELNGQKLVRATANQLPGHSVFEFDLGGRLTTRPYDKSYEGPSIQWMLFEPSGDVLSLRGDGLYSHQPGSTPPNEERWQSLTDDADPQLKRGADGKWMTEVPELPGVLAYGQSREEAA